ncbi:MAG: acyl-CoA thioesterase [Gemmatimonadetes bacterium]|nr:acyl-CoA thioesterase [Gemmatimonadota bacterium]
MSTDHTLPMTDAADPFRFLHPVTVRFRDIDVAGHAHHADALIYFEEARWAYWSEVVGKADPEDLRYVLAECRVRWHARVLWPQTVNVAVRVSRLGRKHFEMEYEVRSVDGHKLQSGTTVQVMYDFEEGTSMRLPDDLRTTLEAFDGPFS